MSQQQRYQRAQLSADELAAAGLVDVNNEAADGIGAEFEANLTAVLKALDTEEGDGDDDGGNLDFSTLSFDDPDGALFASPPPVDGGHAQPHPHAQQPHSTWGAPPMMMPPHQQGMGFPPPPAPPAAAAAAEPSHAPEQPTKRLIFPLRRGNYTCMSKKDIAYVLRMQLSHIQSVDPLADDFYFQVHSSRMGEDEDVGSSIPLHSVFSTSNSAKAARNDDGSIRLPEGTLGRIAASSLRKPKKLMNVSGNSSKEGGFMFSQRGLTYLIEEGIRLLMDIEDVDSLIVGFGDLTGYEAPHEIYELQRLHGHRQQLVLSLCDTLDLEPNPTGPDHVDESHLIFRFMSLGKGRLLVYRSIVLLPPMHAHRVVRVLIWDLRPLMNLRETRFASIMPDMCANMPMPILNECFQWFVTGTNNQEHLLDVLQSSVGSKLAQCFLKRGRDEIMSLSQQADASGQADPFRAAGVSHWHKTYDALVDFLSGKVAALFQARAEEKQQLQADKKDDGKEEEDGGARTPREGLASMDDLWALLAGVDSHANDEQRHVISLEIKSLLESEPLSPLARAHRILTDKLEDPLPAISPAVRYLASVYFPDDHPMRMSLNQVPEQLVQPESADASKKKKKPQDQKPAFVDDMTAFPSLGGGSDK